MKQARMRLDKLVRGKDVDALTTFLSTFSRKDLMELMGPQGGSGSTILHTCGWFGVTKPTMRALVVAGAHIHSRNTRKNTPIHLAVERNATETVQGMIALGAYISPVACRNIEMVRTTDVRMRMRVHSCCSALCVTWSADWRGACFLYLFSYYERTIPLRTHLYQSN